MNKGVVLIFAFAAAIVVLTVLVIALATARRRATETGIPPSRRPGPTDEALEGPLLERYQAYGLVLTAFLTLLMPFLYLHEPTRQHGASKQMSKESVEHGFASFETFCARCHGLDANGGVVKRYVFPNQPGSKPTDVQAPNLHQIWQRHPGEDVAQVAWNTIQHGRPPTPMPTWGVRYGGPMNDQQVTDLVNYLLSIQSDGKQRSQLQFTSLGGGARAAALRARHQLPPD